MKIMLEIQINIKSKAYEKTRSILEYLIGKNKRSHLFFLIFTLQANWRPPSAALAAAAHSR
jgi:hypothetical protein